jgi:hypothetical protein
MTRPQRPRTAPTGTVASADKATGVRTPRFDAGGRSGRIPRNVVVATGERVVEDVKSPATRKLATYRLKVRMVWALYGLRVREVT